MNPWIQKREEWGARRSPSTLGRATKARDRGGIQECTTVQALQQGRGKQNYSQHLVAYTTGIRKNRNADSQSGRKPLASGDGNTSPDDSFRSRGKMQAEATDSY